VYFIAGMTEIVHNGSLICDDLEDNSLKRRGDLCTYRKFGVDYAVNAGCFMYFAPMTKMHEYVKDPVKQSEIWKIHTQELTNIHIGQAWDIHWHNKKGKVPTEDQYF
jgi:geranylgeranyl pyrophosphate synthase